MMKRVARASLSPGAVPLILAAVVLTVCGCGPGARTASDTILPFMEAVTGSTVEVAVPRGARAQPERVKLRIPARTLDGPTLLCLPVVRTTPTSIAFSNKASLVNR